MTRSAVLIWSLFVLIGCSSGGGNQLRKVAFVLPQGWTKAETDDKELAFAVPSGWRQGANTFGGTGNPLEGLIPNDSSAPPLNPDEKKTLDDLNNSFSRMAKEDELKNLDDLRKKGILLQAVLMGKPIVGEELTRFYIKKKSQSSNWTWADTDASEQDCFAAKQKATEVKLPIGLAHRMQATWQLSNGSNYTQISYLIPRDSDLFILRFITEEPAETLTSIESTVAQSVRIK